MQITSNPSPDFAWAGKIIQSLKVNPNQVNRDYLLTLIRKYLDERRNCITEYKAVVSRPNVPEEVRNTLQKLITEYGFVNDFYETETNRRGLGNTIEEVSD